MGQVESAVFEDAPPWDMKMILNSTELQEEEVNFCWKQWASDSLTKKGKIEIEDSKKLFKVLDFDDDDKIEFPELMLYIYSTEENLSRQQKLQRSYNFYDNNGSGKISQEEMVEALVKMEKIDKVLDENGDLVIPEDVLNLFSLMDFAGDGKIKYEEFMKATMHYRRLGILLSMDFLPAHRKALLQKM